MEFTHIDIDEKPEKWPANAIEFQLDNINEQIKKFKKNPSYKNKEVLVSLVSNYDLNQSSMRGLYRTTSYEVCLINSLFLEASFLQINVVKTYIYELIGKKTKMQKMLSWVPEVNETMEIKEFSGLLPQLKIYYWIYEIYTVENNKTFADQLVKFFKDYIENSKEKDSEEIFKKNIAIITNIYTSLLNDISYFRCVKRTRIWAFTRDEIYKLYKLASNLIKLNGDSPVERPLKGVLMTSISNYILKSRNDYSEDYICKYISYYVAEKSIINHELWMSKIENLNDEREQKVVPEIFEEEGWNNSSWAENINFTPTRKYYVSSFCKSMNNLKMRQNYGNCIYGYKDDRMSEILSPIYYWNKEDGTKSPVFSQVIAFDVIYDREEAKEELRFLCNVIDEFYLDDIDKKSFLEEILQYWILSVKDESWSHERERRYVLFMYNDYDYGEIDTNDPRFLKLKTSLLIEPDFILGDNPVKPYIRTMVDNKRKSISIKPYLFCENCLNRDYDIVAGGNKEISKCLICDSKNISIEYLNSK
jgi:hypothetical protein